MDTNLLPALLVAGQVAAGLAAGIITTVGGMGGGLALLLLLSMLAGPMAALAMTAPALLLGNLHRAARYRSDVDWPLAKRLVVGGLLGSLIGALVAVRLPPLIVQVGIVGMTALALAKRLTPLRWGVAPRLVMPITFANGAISATMGGAGLLTAPLLMAAGLSGDAWIATGAVGAVAMHVGRVVGYGLGGMIDGPGLLTSAVLAVAIMAGNEVGVRVRGKLGDAGKRRFELTVMVLVVVMSLAGVAKVARESAPPRGPLVVARTVVARTAVARTAAAVNAPGVAAL